MKSNIKRQHFHICYHFHLHTSVTFTRRWRSRSLSGFAFSTHNLVTLLFGYSEQWYVSTFSTQCILSSSIHQRGRSICRIFLVTDRSQFQEIKNVFQNLGASCLSGGRPVSFSNRRSHQRCEDISVQQILVFWKQGPFWDKLSEITFTFTSATFTLTCVTFTSKGPFWDKLSETTFETATNHSPAKEETVRVPLNFPPSQIPPF